MPKKKRDWLKFYWSYLRIFGRQCYTTWREEILSALLGAFFVLALTARSDPAAWSIFKIAAISGALVLSSFILFHLAHTPLLLARATKNRTAIPHAAFGILGVLIISGMVFGGYEFSVHVWSGEAPKNSGNQLVWHDVGVFSGNSYIETGKRLAFKFYFTPNVGYVTDAHIMSACVITTDIPDPSKEQEMISQFETLAAADAPGREKVHSDSRLSAGVYATRDVMCPSFDKQQADNVLALNARVYVCLLTEWAGEDGIHDRNEYCLWLEHPSPVLQSTDSKSWQTCWTLRKQ